MKGGTLFSGIGAPELAAPEIDWRWCAEIDPFACAVLAERFPHIRNLGDVTRIEPDAVEPVDLVVFGSPCQSFSVAGKRLGLADARGNLAFVALGIIGRIRPRWVVFENVPGLLSSGGGRDFGAVLGALAKFGYGFAYRILDAQYAGVPQRRRRVFVVGCLGDWRAAAAVLFERGRVRWDPPPRREAGERIAPTLESRARAGGGGWGTDFLTLDCGGSLAIAFESRFVRNGRGAPSELVPPLKAQSGATGKGDAAPLIVAEPLSVNGYTYTHEGKLFRLRNCIGTPPRRLTPRECEHLQGLPDDWTAISYRGKPAADGPRYRAIGNSMAVPVIAWILRRLTATVFDGKGSGASRKG